MSQNIKTAINLHLVSRCVFPTNKTLNNLHFHIYLERFYLYNVFKWQLIKGSHTKKKH